MWFNKKTQAVYRSTHDIKAAFPGVSFPDSLREDVLIEMDLVKVRPTGAPYGYVVEEIAPALIGGEWVQQWQVRAPTNQETADKALKVRGLRNQRLTDSDWTQVKDATVDQDAWAAYRQALRDISLQPGFPWEVTWPTQP